MIQVVYFLCSLKNVIAMFALVRSVGNKVYYYLLLYDFVFQENDNQSKWNKNA